MLTCPAAYRSVNASAVTEVADKLADDYPCVGAPFIPSDKRQH
tara:strand:- start:400 stop:528 length:129 start_codon:yes stop_codon:yes gene_type:complete